MSVPAPKRSQRPPNNSYAWFLIALRQRHHVSLALHVHPIEEAHAEQRVCQPVSLNYHGTDSVDRDPPGADRVELDQVARYVAICRAHQRLLTLLVVDRKAARLTGRNRNQRSTRVDDKSHGPAVQLAIDVEMTSHIRGEDRGFADGVAGRHAPVDRKSVV